MNFSKKKNTFAYTIEKCSGCNALKKRKFLEGDVLFAKASNCISCGGITNIEKIFSETVDE